MELIELKEKIVKNQIPKLLIFIGEEVAVRDIYIDKISKTLNKQIKRVDSLISISSKLTNRTLDNSSFIYIISDDKDITTNESLITKMKTSKFYGDNYLILLFNNLDKRNKFYKQNIENIVEFEKLGEEVLKKYILKEIPLNNFNCKTLLEATSYNYMRILLELDKVKIIMNKLNLQPDEAFKYCLDNKVLYRELNQDVFDFINSVALRDSKNSLRKNNILHELEEPPIKIISLLYTLFRNMFIVMSAGDGQGICERTGLTAWQIKNVRENIGRYSIDECRDIMKFIMTVEQDFKIGKIEQSIAVDYILVNIL